LARNFPEAITPRGNESRYFLRITGHPRSKIKGTVKGAKLYWSYKSEHEGQPLTVEYNGELDSAGTIKGTVNVPEFSVGGDFTATRSK
jgi:hypothetical protein